MTRPIIRIAAATLAVLLIAGCSSRSNIPAAQTDSQQPANFSLVTDIPIPSNATMDNERSLILSDRDRWTGRVVMRLWQKTVELTSFYQTQMPLFGWEPVMSVTSDTSVLSYVRGDRAATVQIEKSMMGLNSVVSVTVAPRQANSPSPAATGGGYGADTGASAPAYDASAPRPAVKAETLTSPNKR